MDSNSMSLLDMLDEAIKFLGEYDRLTESLSALNPEKGDELSEILEMRKKLIEPLQLYERGIMKRIAALPDTEAELFRRLLRGESVVKRLNDTERSFNERALSICSLKTSITSRDEQMRKRIEGEFDEVRETLIKSREDKKKLDFYGNARVTRLGGSFDSHM